VCEGAVRRPDLGTQAVGLLEVVAQYLFDLQDPIAGGRFDPVGEQFVQPAPRFLGHAGVRDVADQHVDETVRLVPLVGGRSRSHELFRHEGAECRVGRRAPALRSSTAAPVGSRWNTIPSTAAHSSTVSSAGERRSSRAATRSCTDRGTGTSRKRSEAIQRVPSRCRSSSSINIETSCFEEQRIAAGSRSKPFGDRGGQGLTAEEVLDQRSAVACAQRVERDRGRVGACPRPAGALLEQVGAGEADDEERHVA